MGSACSSEDKKDIPLNSDNPANSPVQKHLKESKLKPVSEIMGDTEQNRRVSFQADSEDTAPKRDARHKQLKRRTYSVVRMEKHDFLQLHHPEMKHVLEDFDETTEWIKSKHDKSYFDDVISRLQDKFLKTFKDYSEPDQRELMGDHLAKIKFVTVIVDYYKFVLDEMGLDAVDKEDLRLDREQSDRESDDDEDDDEDDDVMILRHIRNILWNFSDNSERLGEEIANSKMFVYLTKDLHKMSQHVKDIEDEDFAFMSAVNIIGNCARSPAPLECYTYTVKGRTGKEVHVEMVQCLLPFLKESKREFVRMQTLLVLSHIVNENQFQYLTADDRLFEFLIDMIDNALKAQDRRHNGFSAQELLSGLSGMARNDDIITKIVTKPRPFPLITEVLLNGTIAEQKEACNILHKAAFKPKNKEKIMDSVQLWKKLNELQDSDNEELKDAAKLACFTINSFKKEAKDEENKQVAFGGLPATKKGAHIMISYCQANQKIVMKIYDILISNNFKVWMDIYDLQGESLLDGMSKAVEHASIVLVCYSEDYFFSKNCRTEAEYAYDLNKEKMFVRLQYKYKPTGWLGIVRGTMKYYDFSGHYEFTDKANELLRDVRTKFKQQTGEEGESEKTTAVVPSKQDRRKSSLKPVAEGSVFLLYKWKQSDLDQWLQKNNLQTFAGLKKLTGPQLSFLYKVFKRAPEFFYRCLEEKLGLKSLEDLMRFSDAVEKLRQDYPEIDDVLL